MNAPPKGRRLAYYAIGIRMLRPEGREWLRDDVESGRLFKRQVVWVTAGAITMGLGAWLIFDDPIMAGFGLLAAAWLIYQLRTIEAAVILARFDRRWTDR